MCLMFVGKAMTEAFRLECEARHWAKEARKRGLAWWVDTKERIKKHRGEAGLKKLTDKMNEMRKAGAL